MSAAAGEAPTSGSVRRHTFRDARVPGGDVALAIGLTAQEYPKIVHQPSPDGAPLHTTEGRRQRREPQRKSEYALYGRRMAENDSRRRARRRTYLSLGTGELAAAALFTYNAVWVVAPRSNDDQRSLTFMVGVAPLVVVLCQAGAYWLMARGWVTVRPMPRGLARMYRAFKTLDLLVLVAAGTYIALHLENSGWAGPLALGTWLFAIVEFVNYYVVRLSYPCHAWLDKVGQWRTPRLIQDVHAAA